MSYNDGRSAAIQHHQREGWPIGQFPAPPRGQPDPYIKDPWKKTSAWLRGYRDYYAPIEEQRDRQIQQYQEQIESQGPQVNPEDIRRWEARQRSYNSREGTIIKA